ncbi:MAG TPA: dynamin family protein [Verrucomicrobiae bacterium]|nr:dynamin family protein [Verrucomicrobiae bacterium]
MNTDQITVDRRETAPDQEKLKAYSRIKLSLASQLRLLRDVLKKCGDEGRDRQCEELMVKLAEDRFTLAVLGQFKRGKSSLMNAIIGCELLPTGVLPLTSAITVLKFGPQERLVVEREGLQWPEIVSLSQLEDYVTERGNPGNRKKVKTATVEVPVPFLRRGLEFVDTPGVGSAITANTATTYAFIPQCDAVLFVTSVDSPLTSAELEFLESIRQHVHKIFFVVNKTDLLAEHERREVLDFITKTLHEQMGADGLRIFPLSCKLALAEEDGSGLPPLQEELSRFLSDEKAATFLAAIAERALHLSEIQADDARLPAIRHCLLAAQREILNLPAAPAPPATTEVSMPVILKPAPPEPTAAMKTRSCPVCDHLYRVAFDFFSQWQYAISTDEKAQIEFAAELGFCPLHTWQLNMLSSPVGASVGYAKLVERVSRLLAQASDSSDAQQVVRELARDSKNCRVCCLLREAEKSHVEKLAGFLAEAAGREIYTRSQGACLRHLAMMIAATSDQEVVRFLLTEAARCFEEVGEDMQAFALKTDALRRYLRNEDEQDAYLRAITHLVGNRAVCVPWPNDAEFQ